MYSTSHATVRIHFIALLIAYTLIISLLAPFAIKRAQAAADLESGGKENAPTIGNVKGKPSPNSSAQASGQRTGELLVRFREGVSEHDKTTAVAAHGGRRQRQLRGESRIEKLEVAAGQELQMLATQLRLNPAVEFVEPNFLIQRDDLRLAAAAGNHQRPFHCF